MDSTRRVSLSPTLAFASAPCLRPCASSTTSFCPKRPSSRLSTPARLRTTRIAVAASLSDNASPSTAAPPAATDWVTANGGAVSPLLDFSSLDTRSLRGVTISSQKQTVLKGTQLLELPETTFLTPKLARASLEKRCPALTNPSFNIDSESYLALALLTELASGPDSNYAPLLAALPGIGQLDLPYFWTPEQMEMLRGSPVYKKTSKLSTAIEEEWNLFKTQLFDTNPDTFPADCFSLQQYRWALGIVDSRTVWASSSEPLVLAPVLQNLNPPGAQSRPSAHVEMSGGLFFSKKKILLVLDKDSRPGEEVSISFGDAMGNSDYLLERGLAVHDSMANRFELSFELTALDRFYDDKVDILETAGVNPAPSFQLLPTDENGNWVEPEGMGAYMRLLCLTGPDSFLLEAVFRGEVWDFMSLPVSAENEQAMCDLVIGACEDSLEEYSSTFPVIDEGDIATKVRSQMAKTVVEGEMEILQATVTKYRGVLASLDALEYYAERRLKALDLLRPVDESEIVDSESGARAGRAFDENY